MIVYKGWGVLGILLPLLGVGLMCGIASLFNPSNAVYLKFALIGVVVGSVGTWFVGQWLNQKRPRVKLARWMEERRKELCSLVDQGQFQLAPGVPLPASAEEGYAQVEQKVQQEASEVLPKMTNQHSLYWVPLHWEGIWTGSAALIYFVASFFTSWP